MSKYKIYIPLFLMLLVLINPCPGQKYSIELESNVLFHPKDFYLDYKAVPNNLLESHFTDGTTSNQIEEYKMFPLLSFVPRFSYAVRNPRKGKTMIYSIGLGYSQTGFEITYPHSSVHAEAGVLIRDVGYSSRYRMGYLSIPLGVGRKFKGANPKRFFALGAEVTNHLLIWKSSRHTGKAAEEIRDTRLSAVRDYWVSLSLKPELGFRFYRSWFFSLKAHVGLTPMNLLQFDRGLYIYTSNWHIENAGVHEETRLLNFFYGGGFSISYQLK